MIKKRIMGAVTIKNRMVVQSFGYKKYLPIGKPKVVVENLDRWGVDEIFIQVIDRSTSNLGPDLDLINEISESGILTPIVYAGGIQNSKQAAEVIRSGVERVCVDLLLHNNPNEVKNIANRLGAQAIIGSLPIGIDENGETYWYNYNSQSKCKVNNEVLSLINEGLISELLLIDWENEGFDEAFDFRILKLFEGQDIPLILFGGLTTENLIKKALNLPTVVSSVIGNKLNYTEHAVQALKNELKSSPIRSAYYHDRSIFKHYD